MTNHDLDIYYDEYLKQRKASMKYIKSRKGTIPEFGKEAISKSDFKLDLISMKTDSPKDSYIKLARKYAKEQLYEYSFKQAERFAEAHVKAFGGEVTVNFIQSYRMQARGDIFTLIKEVHNKGKQQGLSSYAVNLLIGQEFFGSE